MLSLLLLNDCLYGVPFLWTALQTAARATTPVLLRISVLVSRATRADSLKAVAEVT